MIGDHHGQMAGRATPLVRTVDGILGTHKIWCELVAMASELTAWMQMLALDGTARAWEPKRLRLRLFSAAGRLVRGGWCAAAAACGCAWPRPGPGRASSPRRSPACRRTPPADQPEPPLRPGKETSGPVEPRPPGATAGKPGTAGG